MTFHKLGQCQIFLLLLWTEFLIHTNVAVHIGDATQDNTGHLKLLFKLKSGTIWQIGSKGDELKIINTSSKSQIVDFDYDGVNNRIVWLSMDDRLFYKDWRNYNNNTEASDKFLFWYEYYKPSKGNSRRISVDFVTNKLYSIHTRFDPMVEVIDFTGKHRSILFDFKTTGKIKDHVFVGKTPNELNKAVYDGVLFIQELPMEIALDPYDGLMFIRTNVSWSSRIHRANMDGTELKLLVPDAGKLEKKKSWKLQVDHFTRRVYWINYDKEIIESVDYDGNNRSTVIKTEKPFTLSILGNHLFWSQDFIDTNTGVQIKFCTLVNNTCEAENIRNISLKGLTSVPEKIKVMSSTNSWPLRRDDPNPCSPEKNNGRCQQLCLLKHSNSSMTDPTYSCACKIGHKLDSNLKDCKPILKYLVYESNSYLRSKALDPLDNTKDYAFSQIFVYNMLEGDNIAAIDNDPKSSKLLYADCRMPVQIDLDIDLRSAWLIMKNSTGCYRNMAYDWKAGKLYIIHLEDASNKYVLTVISAPSTLALQHWLTPEKLIVVDEPLSLIVHPKTGFLYLLTIDRASNETSITRMTMGGQDATILYNADSASAIGLAIDNHENRLYWYTSSGVIRHGNLDGNDVKTFNGKSPVFQANHMIVDEEWIYIKNSTSIWRVRKDTGEEVTCIVPEEEYTKLRSEMRIVERSPENLSYGPDYQITNATCKIYYAYNTNKTSTQNPFTGVCNQKV